MNFEMLLFYEGRDVGCNSCIKIYANFDFTNAECFNKMIKCKNCLTTKIEPLPIEEILKDETTNIF